MNDHFTLQPLLDLMRERADEATRRLGQLIATEQNARSRLKLLTDYREEYMQRFREAQADGLALPAWRNYQHFIDKIDAAINQQTAVVQSSAQNTAAGQEHWQTRNRQLKAIDTLALRHQQRRREEENRQEQKRQDEFSTRKYTPPAEEDAPG
ncbi:MAG: flagellar export protein FliJ [Zoogloeaceae bacterium]|jgi:flagellar FliJ protein|nr:flagellar export protein FliJ [Zoogloeaceae bacterium]